MTEYYGDMPYSEFLMHYGIKGMKWGVRKAIETGNAARLSRNYFKAKKKLAKLNFQADRNAQMAVYKRAKANAIGGSLSSAGLSAAGTAIINKGVPLVERALYSAGAGLAGGLAGLAFNSNGLAAKRFTSERGHAKAIAKRNAWQREMNAAFKGTKFEKGAKGGYPGKKERMITVIDVRSNKRRTAAGASGSRIKRMPQSQAQEMMDVKKRMNKGISAAGALGGGIGAGVKAAYNIHKIKKDNPKQYERFKKNYRSMSFKDRMRYAYH